MTDSTRSAAIQQLREDVVTCTKLLVYREVLDYSGHVSARIPGEELVLIQPRDSSRSSLSAADLLVVDLEGNVVEGEGIPVAEVAIHTGVYRNRPDVGFVCHGHPPLATVFSVIDRPLAPVRHFAYKFRDGLAIHPDPTHIRTREQGDAVAETLGTAGACLLRSHGTVVVGDRIDVLFMDCLDLEENARTLLYAAQLGTPLPLVDSELEAVAASYGRGGHRPGKMWEHYRFRGRQAGVL